MANQTYTEKNAKTRSQYEEAENLKTENVDAPAARFQDEVQINPAIKAGGNQAPDSSFTKKKTRLKGPQLKQEVASEVLTGKGAGSYSDVQSPDMVGLQSMSFGGDSGTILGDVGGTPALRHDAQGTTRFDKRNSDANKQLNYVASEQVLVEYDNIPALAQAPEKGVGYNGNPKLLGVRVAKNTGMSPADLQYDRSLDELRRDEFVFVTGQVNKQQGVDYRDYPNRRTASVNGTWQRGQAYSLTRGNYSPRELHVQIKSDGGRAYVSDFHFTTDNFTLTDLTYDEVNRSANNQVVDMNRVELARQRIDADAGAPTFAHFNPLGRSVEQPSQTVMLLRDMEATTGATVAAAYRFAQKARGYYLNRAAKDGQIIQDPAIDALYGHLCGATDMDELRSVFKGGDRAVFDDTAGIRAGSAFALIKAFDSPTKYNTKADIINQPRGLKMHLQTADNNMNPLRVPRDFIKALNHADVFSTIDRGYDPMSAVCVTDNVRLVYPYDWSQMLAFTRDSADTPRSYSSQLFAYDYGAGSGGNRYVIKCGDPLLNGIAYMFDVMAQSFYNAAGGSGTVEYVIPTVHSTCHFSMWDLLVCAATPYIIYERTNALKDVLDYEANFSYPFTDLLSLSEVNLMAPTNYGMPGSDKPLVIGQMQPTSAIRWTWGEQYQLTGGVVLHPWYFSENSYNRTESSSGAVTLQDNASREFLTPVIRSGIRLDIVDDGLGMDPEDVLLAMDVWTESIMRLASFNGAVYKYSLAAEGIPAISASAFTKKKPSYGDLHSLPRIVGWNMPAYPGECCVYQSSNFEQGKYGSLAGASTAYALTETSSMRARIYSGANSAKPAALLEPASQAISRAQAFQQRWAESRATGVYHAKSGNFDLGLSLSEFLTGTTDKLSAVTNETAFRPFLGEASSVLALHKYYWTRLSKLPLVVNPFDACHTAPIDPFDLAYMFNLAGFMSADYNEEEYNRRNAYQEQGYSFTTDPYMEKNPVFR